MGRSPASRVLCLGLGIAAGRDNTHNEHLNQTGEQIAAKWGQTTAARPLHYTRIQPTSAPETPDLARYQVEQAGMRYAMPAANFH